VATSAGALFIRSYERGERVYVAMLSRGYDGALPDLRTAPAPRRDWLAALAVPATAAAICIAALVTA
jgi:cobalt/nickel transport system permease protein